MCNEALERMRRGIAGPRELELWRMQVAALEVRNHVCLVLSTRRRGDQLTASAVTLSRLKASVVDRSLTLTLPLPLTLPLTFTLPLLLPLTPTPTLPLPLTSYGAGVRYLRLALAGVDSTYWARDSP